MAWEYLRKTLSGTHQTINEELDKLGAQGWELVELTNGPTTVEGYNSTELVRVVMKRAKDGPALLNG